MMNRRDAIKTTALVAAGATLASTQMAVGQAAAPPAGPFTLAPLPYPSDSLEPHIDAKTMEIHHGKHHATYVANLNKAVAAHPAVASKSLDDIIRSLATVPEEIRTAVRNSGGGHYNHSLFWQMMKKGGGQPNAELAKAIDAAFGNFGEFKTKLTDAAMKVFGSGWAWLVLDGKNLKIESTPNQDSPLTTGKRVLLGIDVWEHAYYLNYQNRRADYVAAWFNVINWDFVAERFAKGQS